MNGEKAKIEPIRTKKETVAGTQADFIVAKATGFCRESRTLIYRTRDERSRLRPCDELASQTKRSACNEPVKWELDVCVK